MVSRAFRILLGIAGMLAVVALACYVLGLLDLRGGPTAAGYDFLLEANHIAVLAAVIVAVRSIAIARFAPSQHVVNVVQIVGGAVVGLVAGGLFLLGNTLAGVAAADQPAALNSMILALEGTGQDLAPASFALLAGAGVAALVVLGRRRFAPQPIDADD